MNLKEKEEAILITNSSFYPSTGGVESTLSGMVKGLSQNNRKVIVVSGNKTNTSDKCEVSEEALFGAKIYRYRTIGAFIYFFTCTFLLLKLKKKYVFSAVISRSVPTTLCCMLAGIDNVRYIAPAVYRHLNHPKFVVHKGLRKYISYLVNCFLELICLRSLKKIYVFSDEMAKQVRSINSKIVIKKIFPGVDTERFRPALDNEVEELRNKYDLPRGKKVLLFMGRLESVKNPVHVIDVLEHLSDDYISVVVGEGAYKEKLIRYTNKKNLGGRVYFFPFTNKPEEFYKLSNAFLMVSIYESFGQVILEALASKLPVFGYRNDSSIHTATGEILDTFDINKDKYICDYEFGGKGLANLIDLSVDKSDVTTNLKLFGWYEFVCGLLGPAPMRSSDSK